MILCVTGTGTDVGKTVVTAALAVALRERGWDVHVVKPAQTGEPAGRGDVFTVQRLAGLADSRIHEFARFPEPLAPITAARRAGLAPLSLDECARRVRDLDNDSVNDAELDSSEGASLRSRAILVEGSGGMLVPLGTGKTEANGSPFTPGVLVAKNEWTIADLAADLGAQLIVATSTGLGSLNEAALTVTAAQNYGCAVAGMIGGRLPQHPDLATRCNIEEFAFGRWSAAPWLGGIPDGAGRLSPTEFASSRWIRLPADLQSVD